MIVVASSDKPTLPRHRGRASNNIVPNTAGSWITGYMGRVDRSKPGFVAPGPEQIYPMAYLVEQDANCTLRPHFHVANQFQVFVAGEGRLGPKAIDGTIVQFASSYSAYGPIVAGAQGIHYITLRNGYDGGARLMPECKAELPPAHLRKYRQVISEATPNIEPAHLAASNEISGKELITMAADGLAAWFYRVPPGQSLQGVDPRTGRGQHWVVLTGGLDSGESGTLGPLSCVFLSSEEAPFLAKASVQGLEVLALQYPATN